jgi:hypothetical protein
MTNGNGAVTITEELLEALYYIPRNYAAMDSFKVRARALLAANKEQQP